jgi:glycosyltransferase involved in cell wall biosynthesis
MHPRLRKKVMVSRCHGFDLYEERHEHGYIPFRKKQLKFLKHIFPISINGEKYLRKKYPKFTSKVKVQRLGGLIPQTKEQGTTKESLEILSISRLVSLKRIHLIIEALQSVKRKVHWVHIGEGEELNLLTKKINKLPNNIQVDFKGGFTNAEVLNYYEENHPDVFVQVSSTEGIPVSIMEAMSYAIPVIATNVGGVSELFDSNEVVGTLLDENFKINELSNLLEYHQLNVPKAVANKTFIEQRFNSIKNYQEFTDILLSIGNGK